MMCGLCGILSTNLILSDVNRFKALLYVSAIRGDDSTGIMSGHGLGHISRYRIAQSSGYLLRNKESDIEPMLKGSPNGMLRFLAGHCRAATVGSVIASNAHPFRAGNIMGMHNGTIRKKFLNSDKFDTDSEALINNINDIGLKAALDDVQGYSAPAYALVFFDSAAKTLNFIKNEQRPLYFAWDKGKTTLQWASTKEILELCMSATGTSKADGTDGMFTLPKHELLTFDFSEGGKPKESRTKIEVKEYVHQSYHYNKQNNYGYTFHPWEIEADSESELDCTLPANIPVIVRDTGKESPETKLDMSKLSDKELKKRTKAFLTENKGLHTNYAGYEGHRIHILALRNCLVDGCSICGHSPDIGKVCRNTEPVTWVAQDQFLCKDCSSDPEKLALFKVNTKH